MFLIGRFPSYKSFFISLAAECFDFGDGMLDGCVARWGIRDVDRATGGKLGNEPPIVWSPRLSMDDDGCPVDADVGNEVRRRNLLPVVVEALPDGYVKLDFLVGVHSYRLSVRVAAHPFGCQSLSESRFTGFKDSQNR